MTVNNLINNNPVTAIEQETRRRKVLNRFSAWLPEDCPTPWDLMLYPFTAIRPLKYMNLRNVADLGMFFEKNKDDTLDALTRFEDDFSHAISTILQPGSSWGKEHELHLSPVSGSTKSDGYIGIEQVWHPEYQRYAEHAFNHLINIPLSILEKQRGKQYCNQALSNRVEELSNQLGLSFICDGYNPTVRNAISHGRVKFTISSIEYIDIKPSGDAQITALTARELMRLFDRLVASCSELVTALVLFMLHYWSDIEKRGLASLPVGLLQLALTGAGTHKNLQVTRLIESEIAPKKKQLLIACTTNIISRNWQRIAAFNLTALAQSLSGEKYARFGIEFDCGRSSSASVYLNGEKLLKAKQKNEAGEALVEIFESQLLWYDSPKWHLWFINRWTIFRPLFIDAYEKYLEDMGNKGIITGQRFYDCKHVGAVGALHGVGVEIRVVLKDNVSRDKVTLKSIAFRIMNQQRLRPRRRNGVGGSKGSLHLPSYIRLHIFPQDDVLRNVNGRIKNGALIEVEWEKRDKQFVYVKAPHEVIGNTRIRYADDVLLAGDTKQVLDKISNRAAVTIRNFNDVETQVMETRTEILSAIGHEDEGLQKFWLFQEVERYRKWVDILRPAYQSALEIIEEVQGIAVPNVLNNLVRFEDLPRKEEEVDLFNLSALTQILHAFFLQQYIFSIVEPSLISSREALKKFNSAYHDVLQRCADNNGYAMVAVNVASGLRNALENTLYELSDSEQIKFYKQELGQAILHCSKLMPKYRKEMNNGADEFIKSYIEDARRCLRESATDCDEMQILYSGLVDAPYTMLHVLRRKDSTIRLV